jgi:hypothetical protein
MAKKKRLSAGIACLGLLAWVLLASAAVAEAADERVDERMTFLLTIFLKHDQTKSLGEINRHLEKTGFWKKFPPAGTEVVSWYVMMGIGQVVTLKLPPEKLREVNLAIEENAWGAFKTEFYPTYDFKPIWESTYKK